MECRESFTVQLILKKTQVITTSNAHFWMGGAGKTELITQYASQMFYCPVNKISGGLDRFHLKNFFNFFIT